MLLAVLETNTEPFRNALVQKGNQLVEMNKLGAFRVPTSFYLNFVQSVNKNYLRTRTIETQLFIAFVLFSSYQITDEFFEFF